MMPPLLCMESTSMHRFSLSFSKGKNVGKLLLTASIQVYFSKGKFCRAVQPTDSKLLPPVNTNLSLLHPAPIVLTQIPKTMASCHSPLCLHIFQVATYQTFIYETLYIFLVSLIRPTNPAYLTILDSVAITIPV
jgi:hypothetical protein